MTEDDESTLGSGGQTQSRPYLEAGVGLDRVARPDDPRDQDVAQVNQSHSTLIDERLASGSDDNESAEPYLHGRKPNMTPDV